MTSAVFGESATRNRRRSRRGNRHGFSRLSTDGLRNGEKVPDFLAKIDVYWRLSRATLESQVDDLAVELSERFGPPPDEDRRLPDFGRLRGATLAAGIDSVARHPGMVVIDYHDRERIERLRQAAVTKGRKTRSLNNIRQ